MAVRKSGCQMTDRLELGAGPQTHDAERLPQVGGPRRETQHVQQDVERDRRDVPVLVVERRQQRISRVGAAKETQHGHRLLAVSRRTRFRDLDDCRQPDRVPQQLRERICRQHAHARRTLRPHCSSQRQCRALEPQSGNRVRIRSSSTSTRRTSRSSTRVISSGEMPSISPRFRGASAASLPSGNKSCSTKGRSRSGTSVIRSKGSPCGCLPQIHPSNSSMSLRYVTPRHTNHSQRHRYSRKIVLRRSSAGQWSGSGSA